MSVPLSSKFTLSDMIMSDDLIILLSCYRMRYKGQDLTANNTPSYLFSRQLGLSEHVPRVVRDSVLLTNVICTHDDEYPAIGPDLSQPPNQINPEPPTYCIRFCPVPNYHHLLGLTNEDGRVAVQVELESRILEFHYFKWST